MTLLPEHPHAARIAGTNRVRVFSGPRWLRPDGKTWKPIAELVSVEAVGLGHRITVGSQQILLTPTASTARDLAGVVRENRIAGQRFGLMLNPAHALTTGEWRVTAPGLARTPDGLGWIAVEYDGVKLGLFLHDWARRTKAQFDGDRITLDLRGVTDLDPDTIYPSDSSFSYEVSGTSWDDVHDSAALGTLGVPLAILAEEFEGSYTIYRGRGKFDTSSYSTVSVAMFYATIDVPGSGPNVAVFAGDNVADDSGQPSFAKLGALTPYAQLTEAVAGTVSADLTASYAATANFDVCVREYSHDVSDLSPGVYERFAYELSLGYLELTDESSTGNRRRRAICSA